MLMHTLSKCVNYYNSVNSAVPHNFVGWEEQNIELEMFFYKLSIWYQFFYRSMPHFTEEREKTAEKKALNL